MKRKEKKTMQKFKILIIAVLENVDQSWEIHMLYIIGDHQANDGQPFS